MFHGVVHEADGLEEGDGHAGAMGETDESVEVLR